MGSDEERLGGLCVLLLALLVQGDEGMLECYHLGAVLGDVLEAANDRM